MKLRLLAIGFKPDLSEARSHDVCKEERDAPSQMDAFMSSKASAPCGYNEKELQEALVANRNDTTHRFGCIVLRLMHHSPE